MKIDSIHIYPVKSCRGIEVASADVTLRGLRDDRRWMIVDESGNFLTQRATPRLALIETALSNDALSLSAPGQSSLQVPRVQDGEPIDVTIWSDRVTAVAVDRDADRWLTSFLGQNVRLVWMPDAVERPVDPEFGAAGDHVSFADAVPLLLTSTASLDDLNRRLAMPLPMNRFRPNVVVDAEVPYAEDTWSRIDFGTAVLRVVKPCARCAITTTDQLTAERGIEPLRTLVQYRRRGNGVDFGQNLIPEAEGALRTGSRATVTVR
ncbi:MAG: MOSC domain-containing protein [Thermoanaerobaculia bacterium]